ncbi:MAG: hypothetical protein SGARI_000124 [Bacillariaceae sp.]
MTHTNGGCQFIYDDNNNKIDNPYKNDKYLGNVLILQEYHAKGSDAAEMNSCPDDTGKGGYIMFEFCQAVSINAGRLLDVDGSESADINVTEYDVGKTGDNGYWRYEYEEEDVVKVVFEYNGSGSVEGVEYWYCPVEEATESPVQEQIVETPQPTPNPTPNPTPAPTDVVQFAPPGGCPYVDFDFSDLNNGDWLHDQFWDSKCVKVTAFATYKQNKKNKRGFTPINGVHNAAGGAARVFDTGNKANCDSDLMTPSPKFYDGPNKSCNDCCGGGPHMMKHSNGGCQFIYDGNGEKIDNPYKNDHYLGNVLIIQEYHAKGSDAAEMNSCPDDTGKGGYIMFEFCQPVSVNAGRLLDVDGNESADIKFYHDDGSVTEYDVGKTGDNGYWYGDYEEENVNKVVFEYTGSGSVEGINYWYCPDR